MYKLPQRLKELRIEKGLSFQTLATEVKISHASLCRWENAISEPKGSQVITLARFFNVSTDYLLGLKDF